MDEDIIMCIEFLNNCEYYGAKEGNFREFFDREYMENLKNDKKGLFYYTEGGIIKY